MTLHLIIRDKLNLCVTVFSELGTVFLLQTQEDITGNNYTLQMYIHKCDYTNGIHKCTYTNAHTQMYMPCIQSWAWIITELQRNDWINTRKIITNCTQLNITQKPTIKTSNNKSQETQLNSLSVLEIRLLKNTSSEPGLIKWTAARNSGNASPCSPPWPSSHGR